jgi:hypothetical protein
MWDAVRQGIEVAAVFRRTQLADEPVLVDEALAGLQELVMRKRSGMLEFEMLR